MHCNPCIRCDGAEIAVTIVDEDFAETDHGELIDRRLVVLVERKKRKDSRTPLPLPPLLLVAVVGVFVGG